MHGRRVFAASQTTSAKLRLEKWEESAFIEENLSNEILFSLGGVSNDRNIFYPPPLQPM